MNVLGKINAGLLAASLGCGLFAAVATAAPASAENQCFSNHNLWHVHRRLDGAIDQLNHDDRDYGGHRAAAVADLSAAREELRAAEQVAVQRYNDNPACFQAGGPVGGDPFNWGERGQGGSNLDIWGVRRWVGELDAQLARDNRDYGGHKAAAMRRIQAAQFEMLAAERYARNHGY